MQVFTQATFRYPSAEELSADEPLAIHQRSDPTKSPCLLVFVHGLGGTRAGHSPTWGKTPEFLYEDLPDVDIALYSYRTLTRRLKFWDSLRIDVEAEVLAGILRDVGPYREIILAGHSMGGLLCMGALCRLVETRQPEALARVRGLILAATPQAGSLRVPSFLSWFSNDFWALQPHGDWVTRINRTFTDHLCLDERVKGDPRPVIPTWAMVSGPDAVVDRLSAVMQIKSDRTKTVRDSHTALIKPQSKQHDGYRWLRDCVIACRSVAPLAATKPVDWGRLKSLYLESFDFATRTAEGWSGINPVWWPEKNDPVWSFALESGLLVMENRTEADAARYIHVVPVGHETSNSPASLEVRVDTPAGAHLAGAGLLYRFDRARKEYLAFTLMAGQRFTLYLRTQQHGYEVLHSGRSDLIRPNDFNKLGMDASGLEVRLYINDALIATIQTPSQLSNEIGVICMGIGRFQFDNFGIFEAG